MALNSDILFLTVLGDWKSKLRCQEIQSLDRVHFPGHTLPSCCYALSCGRGKGVLWDFFHEGTKFAHDHPTVMTHSYPKGHTP